MSKFKLNIMKKIVLLSCLGFGIAVSSFGQSISKNALGLRLGDNDGFGAEISYQRGLSKTNRLEIDLGMRSSDNVDAFKLTGIYQWVWKIEGGFNWYAGVGGGLGSWSYDGPGSDDSGSFVFAAGDIGIEYNFKEAPIQLSLDARPEFGFSDYNDDLGFDIGLGIRYRF